MTALPKMSAVMLELAQSAFISPKTPPTSEAAHAALLFAQIAWNLTLGHQTEGYQELLNVFFRSNPKFWTELRSNDPETLIETIREIKERRYAADVRVIVVCGIREGNVRVEWCDEQDYLEAARHAKKRLDAEYGIGQSPGKRRSKSSA